MTSSVFLFMRRIQFSNRCTHLLVFRDNVNSARWANNAAVTILHYILISKPSRWRQLNYASHGVSMAQVIFGRTLYMFIRRHGLRKLLDVWMTSCESRMSSWRRYGSWLSSWSWLANKYLSDVSHKKRRDEMRYSYYDCNQTIRYELFWF